ARRGARAPRRPAPRAPAAPPPTTASASSSRTARFQLTEPIAWAHRLLRRPLRPDLAAPGALRALALQRPAQPRLRELVRPLPRLLPAALDDARLRRDVELLRRGERLRVVHRRPRLPLRHKRPRAQRPAAPVRGVAQ